MVQNQRNSIGAIFLIGLGVLFLIGQIFGINFWSIVGFSWPAFFVIPGVVFLALALTGDRKMSGFVFPGAIITGTGAILWYQNATNHWESWAYMWTLYAVFLGLALMFNGRRTGNENEYRTGRGFLNFGVIGFVIGAAFFELVIFGTNSALTGWLIPLALIGVGGYLLLTGRVGQFAEKRKIDDPVFTGARNIGSRTNGNGHRSHGDDLQRRIDEAIAEDEPSDPKPQG
jgi:hypothetical protein